MSLPRPDTYFAPAARDTASELTRKVRILDDSPLLMGALNAMPVMVLILNTNRQIVAANSAVYQTLDAIAEQLLAKRPGEAIGCIRAKEGPGGCGTSQHCVACGAVHAILESQDQDASVTHECRVLVEELSGISSLDLRVTATPTVVQNERFVVVILEDISQPKRLAVLQKVFFHDVLNTAGCISGYATYLARKPDSFDSVSKTLTRLSDQLVEEIIAQRDLLAAESGDLAVQRETVSCRELLETVREEFLQNPAAANRTIVLGDAWDGTIATDRRLALRILSNMLKNALEATGKGESVQLACHSQNHEVVFSVHNPQVMPQDVQLQVFQRSFSTKGSPGRGIGTYSMKLLGEKYLGGRVDFHSRAPDGTTFRWTAPKD